MFKIEKQSQKKGYKRSRIVSTLTVELGEKLTKKPRLDIPDDANTNHTSIQNRNQLLAIEYFPQTKLPVCADSQPLAIEYFPVSKVPITREVLFNAPTVTSSDADPPSMGGRINPPNNTHKRG